MKLLYFFRKKFSNVAKISVMTPILIYGFIIIAPVVWILASINYLLRWSPWKRVKSMKKISLSPSPKIPLPRYDSACPFACGPASIQMLLERLWIHISQEKIIQLNGRQSVGTSPWEVTHLLNTIFVAHKLHYHAKINPYATFDVIDQKLHGGEPVFVLLIIKFYEKGYSKNAHYPHFGLITHVEKETITIQSPTCQRSHGENEYGELILSIDGFLEKFYVRPSTIRKLEFSPVHIKHIFRRFWNIYINFGFIFYIFAAYYLRILKPGLSIQIEKI